MAQILSILALSTKTTTEGRISEAIHALWSFSANFGPQCRVLVLGMNKPVLSSISSMQTAVGMSNHAAGEEGDDEIFV
jgi:hypothetical protein